MAKLYKQFHEAGLLYCDMKPENIFISNRNLFKLGDFDLSMIT